MSKSNSKHFVYFWEDHGAKNLRESTVGRKGLSLFKLKDMDIPVPEFFVISPTVFKDIVFQGLDRDVDKLLAKGRNPEEEEVEKSILKTKFSEEVIDEIKTCYTRISGFTDAWVSVRSSVVFPSKPKVSFSGIFSTELNVRHMDELLDAIKSVYASMFTDDVVMYCANNSIDLSEVKLSIVVQRMVQAEVSGVSFTRDPITQDDSKMSIEAVYGLGDVIASGEITPDTYVLNKKDLSIVEKNIAPQDWMRVRTVGMGKKKSSVEKISISSSWSHRQKIDERHLQEVSKISLVVENKTREPQSVEWIQAGGRIWILQNKPLGKESAPAEVRIVREDRDTLAEVIRAFVDRYRGIAVVEGKAVDEAKKIVKKQQKGNQLENLVKVAKGIDKRKREGESKSQPREDFILSGIGGSFGTAIGKIKVIDDGRKDVKVTKADILLVKSYAHEMESMIISAGGVITQTGGLTSDIAIVCREFGIPAIVGAADASEKVKDGQLVRLDGNAGTLYKEMEQKKEEGVHPVVEAYSKEELTGIDLLKGEKPDPKVEEHPGGLPIPKDTTLSPTATHVFISPTLQVEELAKYVGNSHGIACIDMDKIMIEHGRHLMAFVEDKQFVEYANEIAEKICNIVEIAHGDEVIVSIGSHTVESFRDITKGKSMENDELEDTVFGLAHYLGNPELLRRVLKIIKRVRDLYKKRNVFLGVHSPGNGEAMKEFKKVLSSIGLRRSSTFSVFAIIDNPTEVILVDEILKAKIDGIILNTPNIARQMQGLSLRDEKAKYSLSTNSVLKLVDNVVDLVKPSKEEVIVICEDDEKLVGKCVEKGVYAIVVNPEDIVNMRKAVAKEEARLIMSK